MTGQPDNGLIHRLASLFALAGGLLLCLLAVITVLSVIGRNLFSLPIPGDFEIVAMGTAVCVMLCLPWCQLQRGQIRVDLFPDRVSPQVTGLLDALGGLLCALIAASFTWRMVLGFIDAVRDRDVTVILGLPLWWAYPFAIASFALLAACCLQTVRSDWSRDRR
jgi:TRAP-type C4-dicarboxylate transport system permease small subunit